MQPQILVLKEGTDQSQGKPQLISNINACQLVVDAVRTTLGPRGMDKLIVDHNGKAVISNDGATIMKLLDIVHPAAKTLVDIAKSQDAEVGDGTTSVVILAGELLKRLKPFVEDGVHPRIIIKALRTAARLAIERVKELAVKVECQSPEEQRELLRKCASTAMSSKLIHQQKDHFSKIVVDAVLALDAPLLPLDMIGIKKVSGGGIKHGPEGCPAAKACTMVLRGGADQFLEETERSLHDAIMIVRRTIKNDAVVAGGGAIDIEISKHLREYSKGVAGKEQLLVAAAARAFEAIPRQLADNAGLDATGLLNKLRQRHHAGDVWYGIDIQKEDIADNYVNCVWEPAVVKINAITAACEAATQILSIDETIKNVKSEAPPQMPGRGMGRPMMG
ncbi:PREDICTED: T-complex protein 1 subunit eta [Papilio polytes]|uniref:T-complex protein 1 subunit eta n=1 Tax=Papilio polytes TaxID=76194 RepID=UPI000675C6CC|nr:PREDICTED: T-complex protein 1 subunit eta [Papilio polytes]